MRTIAKMLGPRLVDRNKSEQGCSWIKLIHCLICREPSGTLSTGPALVKETAKGLQHSEE